MPSQPYTLEIEVLPASHGDAYLIHAHVPGSAPLHMLIDGGTEETYRDYIRPRLQELNAAGESLAALVVTHVDADHIEGAVSFIAENGASDRPAIIPVADVWHNSYRHLPMPGRPATSDEINKVTGQVFVPAIGKRELISARQGSTLAALLRKYGYHWNQAFQGAAIVAPDTGLKSVCLSPGVTITLLSPTHQQLEALSYRWRRELVSLGVSHEAVSADTFESAYESTLLRMVGQEQDNEERQISSSSLRTPPAADTFREDRSVTNASSIAFLLAVADRRVLFLGDALPSVVSMQLSRLTIDGPLPIDAVKVSHHGSKKNTSPEFLKLIDSRRFLISTNGQLHRHPDMETLLWIVAHQKATTIFFNYPTPESAAMQDEELIGRYAHQVVVASGTTGLRLRLPE